MSFRLVSAAIVLVLAGGAASATCPDAPDHAGRIDDLIAQVQDAETEDSARALSNRMWEYWTDAPNPQAQAILDRGMTKRSGWDLLGALKDFDALVAYCPAYAEGYNQRAFVNFLRQDYASALADLDLALKRNPRHVAALSGKALTLIGLVLHDRRGPEAGARPQPATKGSTSSVLNQDVRSVAARYC